MPRAIRGRSRVQPDADAGVGDEIVSALWPGATLASARWHLGRRTSHVEMLALPGRSRTTLLVPLRPLRATAAVVGAHRSPGTTRQRVKHRALVKLARFGAADLVPRRISIRSNANTASDSVSAYLESIVREPVVVGIHLGPPRANRKPIVQVMSSTGRTLAFAKIGVNPLTRKLVRCEAITLDALANVELDSLEFPRVLHAGRWGECELLVLGPVPTTSWTGAHVDALLERAMVELCGVSGRRHQLLPATDYWHGLRARIEKVEGDQAEALLMAAARLQSSATQTDIELGAWHGDWTPWNMSTQHDRVVVWDWERFCAGVPAGLDALHFALQSDIRRGGLEPRRALRGLVARSHELLAAFDVRRGAAPLVTALYLLEIGARYLEDDQQRAGARLGDLSTWLLPELATLVESMAEVSRP